MSKFISNKSCEMCHKIEVGLVEMRVAKTNHYLCYNCMTKFAFDMFEYAALNLREEFKLGGYDIGVLPEGGFSVERLKD